MNSLRLTRQFQTYRTSPDSLTWEHRLRPSKYVVGKTAEPISRFSPDPRLIKSPQVASASGLLDTPLSRHRNYRPNNVFAEIRGKSELWRKTLTPAELSPMQSLSAQKSAKMFRPSSHDTSSDKTDSVPPLCLCMRRSMYVTAKI